MKRFNGFPVSGIPASLVATARHRVAITLCAVLFTLCAVLFAATGSSFAQSPAPGEFAAQDQSQAQDPVVARVGDTQIRESDLRLAEEDLKDLKDLSEMDGEPATKAAALAARREYLITFMSDMILLSKAAKARNLGNQAEVKRRMEFTRDKTLMDMLLQTTGEAAATDDAVRRTYDELYATNPSEPELHLRQIVFRFSNPDDTAAVAAAESKAKVAIKRISEGEDFAKVASDMSDDLAAKIHGGEAGFMIKRQMGKEYADVAFTLHKGEVSAPFKTQIGWHIIKVEGEGVRKPLEFEVIRDRLAAYVSRQAQLQLVADLRKATPIERLDKAPATTKPAEAGK